MELLLIVCLKQEYLIFMFILYEHYLNVNIESNLSFILLVKSNTKLQ